MPEGRSIKPCRGLSRRTRPPSWSTAMNMGPGAAARSTAVRRRSCSGERMLRSPPPGRSRSKSSTCPTFPERTAARKGSPGASSAPRKPSISMEPSMRSREGESAGSGEAARAGPAGQNCAQARTSRQQNGKNNRRSSPRRRPPDASSAALAPGVAPPAFPAHPGAPAGRLGPRPDGCRACCRRGSPNRR